MFYAYAAPEPPGFKRKQILPANAFYNAQMSRVSLSMTTCAQPDPKAALLDFCQSTYEVAAINGKWDRAALEHPASGTR